MVTQAEGSYLVPSFEHAHVADAMRSGVISCSGEATLVEVARIMATNHVHALVVRDAMPDGRWGIVTATDVVEFAGEAADRTAASCANADVVTVGSGQTLEEAAALMRRHDVSHLAVVDPAQTMPLGVLSTLDLAGVVAWGRA
jgi:CBS domain-containing protein